MKKEDLLVLLDPGHGSNTAGKRSPDGLIQEWDYARKLVAAIQNRLTELGVKSKNIHPEDEEIGGQSHDLNIRTSRANTIYTSTKLKTIFISVHLNAKGMGNWENARGWSAYTSKGITRGDELANCLYRAADNILWNKGIKVRKDFSDGDPDYEADYYVLKHTIMPAVLTENCFMDNKEDCKWLNSVEGFLTLVDIHVEGILTYINSH